MHPIYLRCYTIFLCYSIALDVCCNGNLNGKSISQLEKLQNLQRTKIEEQMHGTVVLVLCCDRPKYLQRTLESVFNHFPLSFYKGKNKDNLGVPIYISQDGNHQGVQRVVTDFVRKSRLNNITVKYIQNKRLFPKQNNKANTLSSKYQYISYHFGWTFNYLFQTTFFNPFNEIYSTTSSSIQQIIVLEDDLEIASDFFSYMMASLQIIRVDPTVWSASGFHDNGQTFLIDKENSSTKVHRSDYFSGLGWILTRDLWDELGPKWPDSYWDDWMRKPEQRKNRVCIRPEVSRSITFGKFGVSNGQYFRKYLSTIYLNTKFVNFHPFLKDQNAFKSPLLLKSNETIYEKKNTMDLSNVLKKIYDKNLDVAVNNAKIVNILDLYRMSYVKSHQNLKIFYSLGQYNKTAIKIRGINPFSKSGIPLCSYWYNKCKLERSAVVYLT